MDDLEAVNTAILGHAISSVLTPGRAYTFAIDYTNDPYYGTVVPENEGYVIRSQLKKSTNDFYSYVTVYAITRNRQVTLAVYPVTKGTSKVAYIARCLDAITAAGFSTSLISLRDLFHSFAFLVSFGYPGFLNAGTVRTILKVDRTASQINSRKWSNRNARISMVRGPGFTGENRVQSTVIQRFLRRNEIMAKR
mgnify:CR=1 FL=1